jgi:queuine tRNA-ribosyltransferase
MAFKFEILHQSRKSKARVGKIHTPHGIINTPNFVAVGTNGTLKALDNHTVTSIGLELMFCNTYHLLLQPGPDVVQQGGGLHRFIQRDMPIITDSGGFQVFSLAYGSVANELKSRGTKKADGSVLKITEDGVLFRSYRDGSKVLLTPETSIQAQKKLGADIIIPLDELPPYHIDKKVLIQSLERTHRWEERSLHEHLKNPQSQAIYAVVHGGVDEELRNKSCDVLSSLPFDGFAIGGSLGKTKQELFSLLEYVPMRLDRTKPNHLLGIGDLESIDKAVGFGIDTLDSSYPTKAARHAIAITSKGPLNITKGEMRTCFEPLDKECRCPTCQKFTVAYLHHLFKAKEMTAYTLASIHNVYQMVKIMENYRQRILNDEI